MMPPLGKNKKKQKTKNKQYHKERGCLASDDYKCSCTVAPEKPYHTASEHHRTAIPTQYMLWKQCCQAALSLTLSCDNPSSVIHKPLLFRAGKDIKAILVRPVSLSSQDGEAGDCSSTQCREIGWKMDGQPASFVKHWYILIWWIHCIWDHMIMLCQ